MAASKEMSALDVLAKINAISTLICFVFLAVQFHLGSPSVGGSNKVANPVLRN